MAKKSTDEKIDALADLIERLVNKEVLPVAAIAPVAPVAPIAPLMTTTGEDHVAIATLVVSVRALDTKFTEKFADIKNDIKGLSDGTASQLADHETRIRTSEAFRQGLLGKISVISGAIAIVISVVMLYLGKHLGF